MNIYEQKYLKYKNKYLNYKSLQKGGTGTLYVTDSTSNKYKVKPYQEFAYKHFIKSYIKKVYISSDHTHLNAEIKKSNYKIVPGPLVKYTLELRDDGKIYFINEYGVESVYSDNGNNIIVNDTKFKTREHQKTAYDDFIKKEIKYCLNLNIDEYINLSPIDDKEQRKFTIKKDGENILLINDYGDIYIYTFEPDPIESDPIESDQYYKNAKLLYSIYNEGYAFPKWILEPTKWKDFKFKDTMVLFDYTHKGIDEVKTLVTQREPVNITMMSLYNADLLATSFHYRQSYYITAYERDNELPPNIAIYCKALVKIPSDGNDFSLMHVISLIGYGFDTIDQPDYKYYKKLLLQGKDNEYIKQDLILKYRKMWLKACITADKLKLKKLVLFNVGGGAFSELLHTHFGIHNFINEIFIPSFSDNLVHTNITTPQFYCRIKNIDIEYGFNKTTGEPIIFVPNGLASFKSELNNILFVNAWDPHTIIGNGNEKDNTLDGFWGRISNLSVLSSPLTNNNIKYHEIKY